MKYIVIIGAVLSVALYYIIAEVIWQMRNRSFRRRLIIGVLIMALLASQIDFISIFTRTDADRVAAAEVGTQSRIITAFVNLPDGISKQAVPVGTALEELVLPDTLEAVCVKADTEADTDTKTDADTSDSQVGGGSVNQGDSEEVAPSEDAGQEDETPENPDENSEEEAAADAEMQTETGSFTMPEYQAGNIVKVKTLEMAPAANYGTIEETIIIENITWQPVPEYDGDTEGEYVFTAVLPEGYVLTNGAITPQITVTVGGTDNIALLSGDGIMPIAETHTTHDGIATAWTDSTSLPTTAGSYYLDTDVTLSMRWSPSVSITLCLNGHSIDYNNSYPAIDVKSGVILDIYDCQDSGTVTNGSNYALQINNGGTANINGGNFITNSNSSHSAITNAKGGTLNMSGGEITFSSSGYGIDNSGNANVKNVKIIYAGSRNDVSGIYSRGGGTITVEDCEIDSKTGRCVYASYGTVTIIGGRFNGDYGIRMGADSAKFNLSGSPTFTSSTADIYMMFPNTNRITVTGPLSNTTPYSVLTQTNPTEGNPVVFTDSSTTSYNDETKFKAAKDGYIVRKNSSGQLELVQPAVHTHDGITFTAWTDTISPPTSSGNYYLEYDINGAGHALTQNKNINLCLNGHTINATTSPSFDVYGTGTLNIYDCQGDGKVTNSKGNVLYIKTNGIANIYGGTFSNSTTNPPIYVDGTVTIENATVSAPNANAVAIGSGGMATIKGGTFEATGNFPTIYALADSSLKITDGTFINNNGENVIQNLGTLDMSGGTVTGKSTGARGVVGILNYGGKATIKNVTVTTEGTVADGDTADKGLRNDNGGTMIVENCNVISNNRAVWNAGGSTIKISSGTFNGSYGMYNDSGIFELSGSPTFTGSTADIYLSSGQKITVTGNLGNAAPYSVLTQTNPTADSPVVITDSSTTSYNVAAKFTAANSRYAVSKNSSGQLELAVIPHTHNGITFEPWTDTETLPTSGSYYLENDDTLSVWLDMSANLNLCLNGHTITYDGLPIRVRSGGTLGIYDCQGNGSVTADSYCIRIFSGGTANIYGGTFNSTDYEAIHVDDKGTVTIENASVFSSNSRAILNNGMATINGGTFENTAAGYPTIQLQSGSTTKISGGTFIRNVGSNIIQNQGTLEMSGGTVTGKSTSTNGAVGIVNAGTATIKNVTVTTEGTAADDDTKADKGLRNDIGGTMTVENCNVTSTNRAVWNTGSSTIKISGGTFNGRYGMYNDNGTFELSGSPTFTGSTADIYLSNNQKITVTGTLGNAAPYSVLTQTNPTAGSPVVITDSSNTSYNNADKFTPANNSYILRKNSSSQLELAALATYTITYNAGSYGSGSVSSGTKTEGVDYTLSSDTFTRTGYTQTGWSKNSNGSTKDYALGEKYTDDASITLYPYWTANQYTVTLKYQDGRTDDKKITVTYGSTYGSDLPSEPSRTGYQFVGWFTQEVGGDKVDSNSTVTTAQNYTLFAQWTANEYGITYMDQGGAAFSGTHESGYPTKHTYGTATTLKSASKAGFTFSGWYTNSSCTGSAVTSLSATGYTSDITLYAKWTGPEYDITYMDQGGETFSGTHESGYPTKHAYGTATTLKSASKAGYTFNGWYTDSGCTNKVTSLGAIDYTSDITLYAKWTEGTAPSKTEGGSSSGGGGSTGGNSGSSSSGSGNGSQPSDNNSGGSLSDDSPSDSVTPSTGTMPPKTGTVEMVMPDAEPQKEQTKDTQTDTTSLTVGEGIVRVTVVSDGYQYAAGVTDTEAVADAVLTPEQIQLVSGGESIEIRVEVTDISDQVSQQDRDIIEGGLADYKITGDTDGGGELTLGAYIDISMYIRIGDGDWDAITKAGEPIEVVIGIPDDLLSDERTYYIARSHEGEFALLNDLDNEPDTITIKTELFSTYAIVYRQPDAAGSRCGLCHICPTFLGICCFIWLVVIMVVMGVIIYMMLRKQKQSREL